MKPKEEIILMAISSFCDENNFADFIYNNTNVICKNDSFKETLKSLITLQLIEDLTTNGHAKHIKVFNPVECPDFIFKEMDIKTKEYVLKLWKDYKTFGEFKNRSALWDKKLQLYKITDQDIIGAKTIKNKISSDCTLIKTNLGYKLVSRKADFKNYCCSFCGETDPEKFDKGNHSTCKKCINKLARHQIPISQKLYKRASKNAIRCGYEFDLDTKYIEDLLQKQNNKCVYSGIELQDNFRDKYTYPTIDRIDSNKGYIKGNVCICTFFINMMKNNASVDQFKDIITKIYNNMGNF